LRESACYDAGADDMATTEPPIAEVTLNGWKEIATYLGKSVRSVQRWERELGLPVHRINTPEGAQIIFVTRAEIEAWRDALDVGTQHRGQEGARGAAQSRSNGGRWRRIGIGRAAFLALGIVIGAAAMTLFRTTLPGAPRLFEIDGDRLTASTSDGTTAWTFAFGRAAHHPPNVRATRQGDVDGDGSSDVVVAVRFAAPLMKSETSDAILAFRADGSLIWQVQPALRVSHQGETFDAPWQVLDFEISPDRARPRVWIAYAHQTWPPSFVLEVDPRGGSALRYVQPGWIHALAYWRTPTGALLAAGGIVNEYGRASVALLDVEGAPGRSVSDAEAPLTCDGCPHADPVAFFLVPPSEMPPLHNRPYNRVRHLVQTGAHLNVSTDEGFAAGSVVTITPDFEIAGFERSDRFWQVHNALEKKGQIGHTAETCPDREPPQIRVWAAGSGWLGPDSSRILTDPGR
jgi:hypothetical protein